MLLRSSSTPVLGSLIPSFSESPNNNSHQQSELFHSSTQKQTQPSIDTSKLSCTQTLDSRSLFHSPSLKGTNRISLIRRVQSEGNLQELGSDASSYGVDELSFYKKIHKKPNFCTLEAIPSFSIHNFGTREKYYSDEEEESEEEEEEDVLKQNDDSFKFKNSVYEKVRRRDHVNDHDYSRSGGEGKMYLASGLGISGTDFIDGGGSSCGGGGGGSFKRVTFDMDGGGESRGIGMEEHYKKVLEENPGNPLVLRNFAQFLYQKKEDLERAEEYYSRAILADPQDGEILSQYAKLIWELHGDKARALNYFDRAVQASSEDSHIHAAYASFLWDMDDDNDDEGEDKERNKVGQLFHHNVMASATA